MLKIIKKHGKIVKAYRLGDRHPVLEELMKKGKIVLMEDGTFEVFSQEAVQSESGHGQKAVAGDWIRLDSKGFPYPCTHDWFQENMRPAGGDDYEQIPRALSAWTADQEMCHEVEFLIREKGLKLDENNFEKYYSAILWGNPEAADRNAVLVFYSISYGADGRVTDADYNFVTKSEFDLSYDVI